MTHPRRSFSTSPAAPWLVVPNFNPQCAWNQPRRSPQPPCLGHRHCRRHPLPPPPSCSSTYVHHGPFSHQPLFPGRSAPPFRHPLPPGPGDGTTRKAGFKIIMARAILITVARTTTISGWHHHYKSVVHGVATSPTAVRTLLLPVRLISHCTYRSLCEPAIDVRSGLCKDTAALKYT